MPLPIPHSKESKDAFISRCVSELAHEADGYRWPKNDQRLAVCYLQWDKKNENVEYSYLDIESYANNLEDKMKKYLTPESITTTDVATYAKPITKKPMKRFNPKDPKKSLVTEIDKFLQKSTSYNIIEGKVSSEEILIALGGEAFFKKNFKTVETAYKFVEKNLNKISEVLNMKIKDFPSRAIKTALSKIIKEKR